MAMQETVVRLSPKMVRELDSIALEKKTKRECIARNELRENRP
jgi:predicted transcriptional regulator